MNKLTSLWEAAERLTSIRGEGPFHSVWASAHFWAFLVHITSFWYHARRIRLHRRLYES